MHRGTGSPSRRILFGDRWGLGLVETRPRRPSATNRTGQSMRMKMSQRKTFISRFHIRENNYNAANDD